MAEVPECLACGACCHSRNDAYVPVTAADLSRMTPEARSYIRASEGHTFMRMAQGRCSALQVDRRRGIFACAIYGVRPQVCRDLARGSKLCRANLANKRRLPQVR